MVETYEKLGLFYLGKDVDRTTQDASEALTLLKNKNFKTYSKATLMLVTRSYRRILIYIKFFLLQLLT